MPTPLDDDRERIDAIDDQLLNLLSERNTLAAEISATKIAAGLPIFAPEREKAKVESFRQAAELNGLDPDWSEDFLRLVMSSSRDRQSQSRFPCCAGGSRTILLVGGNGRMGRCYGRAFAASGHQVRVLDVDDWPKLGDLCDSVDAVIITVPIRETTTAIERLAPHLAPTILLADFTSLKTEAMASMLAAHPGPVLGLHPLHGPEVTNLAKQLITVCPGRGATAAAWLREQFELWGLRTVDLAAQDHDRVMDQVQGLRHFVALLHGSFLREQNLAPTEVLALSSPIYRAEVMMTGRIFAQNAELYADIVFATPERRALLLAFLDHHHKLGELVRNDDKAGFIREFEEIGAFFGHFAEQARTESEYLINRLADRFV